MSDLPFAQRQRTDRDAAATRRLYLIIGSAVGLPVLGVLALLAAMLVWLRPENNPLLTRCSACHQQIAKAALFCPHCGLPTREPEYRPDRTRAIAKAAEAEREFEAQRATEQAAAAAAREKPQREPPGHFTTLDGILTIPSPEYQTVALAEFYGGSAEHEGGLVTVLDLSCTDVDDAALLNFRWSALRGLHKVNLRGTKITSRSLDCFYALRNRAALESVDFRATGIFAEEQLRRFRGAFPACDVRFFTSDEEYTARGMAPPKRPD